MRLYIYKALGLKIAEDKTLTLVILFHFLNRMYAKGSKIVMPFCIFTKICSDLSIPSQLKLDSFMRVRGAIAKVTDPVVAYALYIRGVYEMAAFKLHCY
jgi:hypothetical protein